MYLAAIVVVACIYCLIAVALYRALGMRRVLSQPFPGSGFKRQPRFLINSDLCQTSRGLKLDELCFGFEWWLKFFTSVEFISDQLSCKFGALIAFRAARGRISAFQLNTRVWAQALLTTTIIIISWGEWSENGTSFILVAFWKTRTHQRHVFLLSYVWFTFSLLYKANDVGVAYIQLLVPLKFKQSDILTIGSVYHNR